MSEHPANEAAEQLVVCVDDDLDFLKSLEFFLPEQINRSMVPPPWFRFLFFTEAREALDALRQLAEEREVVAMIISDQKMPHMKGTDFLMESRKIFANSVRVLLTGHAGIESAIEAINANLLDKYLTKPIDDAYEFTITIRHLLQRSQMLATIEEQNRNLVIRADELAKANARLQMLDRLKGDFLRFVSHELRTPLVGMSAVSLLEPGQSSEEQAEIIEMVKSGYERLETFVQSGIDYFAWLGEQDVDLSKHTDLSQVVAVVADGVREARGSTSEIQIAAPEAGCLVRGDQRLLEEVVKVLLDNAVKFSSPGDPVLASLAASSDDVTLTVSDRGAGFPPEMCSELFHPLTIGNVMHHSQGSGLSLAKANHIIKAHGGSIQAESQGVGQGATFIVRLAKAA